MTGNRPVTLRRLKSRIVPALRGAFAARLLKWADTGSYDPKETLLVTGSARSGTTWIAELLTALPKSAILFEPDNIKRVPEARLAGGNRQNFRLPDADYPEGEILWDRILRARVLNFWTASQVPIHRVWGINRWIVKSISANQMLGWLMARFSLRRPLLVIRHPCAVYASRVSMGWGYASPVSRKVPFLVHYPQFVEVVARLKHPEEYAAAKWAMQQYTPLALPSPHPFCVVSYERLVVEGVDELRRVFEVWDLPVPDSVSGLLSRPSAKASEGFSCDPKQRLSGWRSRLSTAQIDRMLAVVKEFGINFYGPDPEPDYQQLYSERPLYVRERLPAQPN